VTGSLRARLRRRGVFGSIFAPVRYLWLRAVRSSLGARYLAGGFAVGVFWGCFPIFFLHWPFALATAYLLRWSRLAATAGVCLSNPLTIPPLYTLAWVLGHALWPTGTSAEAPGFTAGANLGDVLMSLSWADFGAMLLGGACLGAVFSVPAYFVALRLAQSRVQRRLAARATSARRAGPGGAS
jgi:uncharacterized protein (DUF2062 family)